MIESFEVSIFFTKLKSWAGNEGVLFQGIDLKLYVNYTEKTEWQPPVQGDFSAMKKGIR